MRTAARAFTLIELLVVIAIFSTVSLIILANHSRFNSSVLLGSLAYDIALSIREAQVYGLSVATFNANFQVGYGIHVTAGTSYLLFADTNASRRYEAGTDSILDTYSVGQGHTVSSFCGILSTGAEECSNTGAIDHLDIVFFRPDPDANITSSNPGYYSSGKIVVASPSGETRTITVASTGQISVSNQ